MKVIFDLRKVGLGNNGGASTVVKSANILVELGHEIFVVDSFQNKHTWEPLRAEHIITEKNSKIPNADVIIATGYKSVSQTISSPKRCGRKFHWIRAWETWQYDEKEIVNNVLNAPTIKIVNSICLQNKLKEYNIESYIIRPGYDFHLYYPTEKRNTKKDNVIIGGLYREGVHGKRKRTAWLFNVCRVMKGKFDNVKFHLFGSEPPPGNDLIDHYLKSPLPEQKNEFLNNIDIWMAPTESEGLHMPPAEAMMTECPVVGTNAPLSGTQDYLEHKKTGIVTENNIDSFIDGVLSLYHNREYSRELGKNALIKIKELGDRKENMNRMINLFKEKL